MSQRPTEYVAAEVRAEMGRQDHDKSWLAGELGVSEMWVGRRVRGVTEFSVDDLCRVAEALGVSPTKLLPEIPARVG